MTSPRQIDTNRRNARFSTGPVTAGGKQRSRRNALRHGLTAETIIHALEDAEDYRFRNDRGSSALWCQRHFFMCNVFGLIQSLTQAAG